MQLPDIKQLNEPSALIAAIGAYIDEAQRLTNMHEAVALAGLDTVVDALCQRVVTLAPEEGQHYREELEKLVARLNALQTTMVEQKEEIAAALKTVEMQRKANLAYAMGKPKHKDTP